MRRFGHIVVSPWQTKIDKNVLIGSLMMIAVVVIIEQITTKGIM